MLLQDSNDLLHALEDSAKEPLTLRSGDGDNPAVFELEWKDTRPTFANISGTNLSYSQVHLYKTFPVSYFSKWNNLLVEPQGDFAAFNCDFAASSTFTDVWVRSRMAKGKSHYHKKNWSYVTEHEGVGWEVTALNTGDSSYDINFVRCRMAYGRIGFDIQKAGVKGTVKWTLDNPILDSCDTGIRAFNAGELWIRGGNIQLSRNALWFDHCSNVEVDFLNCERGELDALITPDCHEITFVNSRITTIDDVGRRARFVKRQSHRNVDSYR